MRCLSIIFVNKSMIYPTKMTIVDKLKELKLNCQPSKKKSLRK